MAAAEVFGPARLGPVGLRNRFIKAATFEGMAADGLVTDALIDFHRTVAAGGVAMTTLAYLAVSPDGQGAPTEIVVRPEAVPGLARLVDAVHAEGARASAQLGHAGPVADRARATRGSAPSKVFTPMAMKFTRAAHRRRHRPHHRRLRPGRGAVARTPASTRSSSTWGTTTCSARS